ncbi:MAG TPA: nuclear transport factor 2 family protein [Actinomycetes bacterium]|jgi:ketosteroid isomerase-like protein|nr:nuclear transport factor 2 family protein [Actinomycetes bacterium]
MPDTATADARIAEAQTFVDNWLRVWRERDGHAYAELLHDDCVFDNPITPIPRDQLPQFVDSLLAVWPDHRIQATRWAATADGALIHVLIEWVATGTLAGSPIELRGADRYTLRDGKVAEGVAYFDPRPVLERQQTSPDQ